LGDRLDWSTLGPLLVGWTGVLLYALSPHRGAYWVSLLTILSFALAPLAFPNVRVRLETSVCPLNWALFVFCFQLVVAPLLVCWNGPFAFTLPLLPSTAAINIALLVSLVAWFAFVAGCEIATHWRPRAPRVVPVLRRLIDWVPRPAVAPERLAVAFGVLGVVGLGLAFHSPSELIDYFHKAGGHVGTQSDVGQSGVVRTASVILRSFLAFAFIIPWCMWIDRRRPGERLVWRTLAVAVLASIASSTYSYNRASAVAPIVVMAGVYGLRVMRLRLSVVLMVTAVAIALLTASRAYRNTNLTISQALTTSSGRQQVLDHVNVDHEVQVYASAPQFLGYLLAGIDYGRHPRYGKTLVSSAMYPVPRLGGPFRNSSGVIVYNRLIYGNAGIADQVVPFQGELFLDFAWGGVLVGYVVIGLLVSRLQRAFERASSAFDSFAWQYVAVWLAFLVIGSLAVVSQTAIYFFWPLIVFAWLRADRAR
jgi:hypothetical protein